jgi:hypothetical protein
VTEWLAKGARIFSGRNPGAHVVREGTLDAFVEPVQVLGNPRWTGKEPYKSSCAAGDFAAVMAITRRTYTLCDRKFSRRVSEAARKAWIWLEKSPNVTLQNPPGVVTGRLRRWHLCRRTVVVNASAHVRAQSGSRDMPCAPNSRPACRAPGCGSTTRRLMPPTKSRSTGMRRWCS